MSGARFTAEEEALRDEIRRFAERELAPRAAELDAAAAFPWEHLKKLAPLGVLGLNLPEEYGGVGATPIALALVMEEIAAGCAATASVVGAHYLATDAILLGGDEAMKQRFLPAAAAGERLGAFALTEPRSGSDPAGMLTRAEPEGAGWRLIGSKHFISNGAEADFIIVFARTDPAAGHRGIGAFVVERGTHGLQVGKHEDIMGIRAGRIYELSFDCFVPHANCIGAPGTGFKTAMMTLDRSRIEIAAMSLGLARAALDAAMQWARDRKAYGEAIASYQGIRWMLADMATELEAARHLTWHAARCRAAGGRFTREAAMAKLFASEMAGRVTDHALQIHGGYGYTRGLPLERYVRDARILRIFEGSSEIHRNVIARQLLG
jgi:alkylation response protein AidB-like acyl-CoA dehydrogenase